MKNGYPRVRILIVGAVKGLVDIDSAFLRRNEIAVVKCAPGPEAINLAQRDRLDLVVINVAGEEDPGLELCTNLKSLPVTTDIPVLVLLPLALKSRATHLGANEIVYKPFLEREFLAAVARFTPLPERRHARYPVNLRFTFHRNGTTGQAFSRVLSNGGAYLKTDRLMKIGTRLELVFRLPGADLPIQCAGVVRNSFALDDAPDRTPGFGVQFEGMAPNDRSRLTDFVESLEGRLSLR